MLGKPSGESLSGRVAAPVEVVSTTLNKDLIFLDYVISRVSGDQRPYLTISIMGCSISGLLDSGANRSLLGSKGYALLSRLGLPLRPEIIECTVANGQKCYSIGFISAPVTVENKVRFVDFLVIPDLPHQLILGVDFWITFDIVPDLRNDCWHFSETDPTVCVQSINSGTSLSNTQRIALDQLIEDQRKIMSTSSGRTHLVSHSIELLPGTKPIKQRYYPVSPAKQQIIDAEVQRMLAADIIEPCRSPWSSPVCMVPKKDGTFRFCVDYRQVNAVTRKDAYPLPLISAIMDQLREAKYLSSLDIKSAYHQVPIDESSRDVTAFVVPNGLYRFKVMSFGLTNAPGTYQRLMDAILGPELQPSVFVYLDDIVIVSKDFESHMEMLSLVFDRLHAAGLVVSFDKCQFCRPQLKYLGFVVDELGLRPDPDKVESILRIPPPRTVKEVRRFVGTCSWYRKWCKDFASVVSPLTALTKKHATWRWSNECDLAFKTLKENLVSAPILTCPDFSKTFHLSTDASAVGVGCVLSQFFDDGEKVICYLSRSLTPAERKFSATERELLAVIWSVEKLRPYLEGFHFKVITDCHSLLWLHRLKDPQGRLARWQLRLMPYDYEVIHRKGSDHAVPDFLSRSVPIMTDAVAVCPVVVRDKWYHRMFSIVQRLPQKYPLWRIESNRLLKHVPSRYPDLVNVADEWKLAVPKDERLDVIRQCHDIPTCGHGGVTKTVARVSQKYYWPKLRADVAAYIRRCEVCLSTKPDQRAPAGHLLSKVVTATRPWQIISADLIGPLPRSSKGYAYILVVCDNFSKFVLTFPLRTATALSVTHVLENNVFLLFGAPNQLIVDNGVQFRSRLMRTLAEQYNVKLAFTANYHAQANATERVNRVIKCMLTSYVKDNHRLWDRFIYKVGFAIRSSKHESTGVTPNLVNFGREVSIDGEEESFVPPENVELVPDERKQAFAKLYQDIRARILKAHKKSAHVYNLRRRVQSFQLNQRVWRRNYVLSDATKQFAAKLAPKFVGPFTVTQIVSPWTYQLTDHDGRTSVWHIKDLKAHPPDDN